MLKTIGLVTANYSAKHPTALSDTRPIASLPYVGRYRMVDFALSNMINCGIRTVGLIMPYNYRSLIDHVGSGKDWMLDRKNGGLFSLPGTAFGTSRTGSRFLLRDLIENKVYLERSTADNIVVSSANMVYNMDYKEVVETHEQYGADITAVVFRATEDNEDIMRFDVDDGRITGFNHGVHFGDTAFLDCFVVKREKLLELLEWYSAVDYLDLFEALKDDFGRVRVMEYRFNGYVAPVFSTDSYFKHNMDLLNPEISAELFPADRTIKTKAHDTPPAKYEKGCYVRNSVISAGSRIWGSVADSILGRNVIVESGATIRNSIIMQSCIIRSGARVENAIVDRNNELPASTELRGTPENILIKEKGRE